MPSTFIIDGYNLIRLLVPSRGEGSLLGTARDALEAKLRAFRRASEPGTRIHLVYDGESGHAAPASREKGFQVYFSRPPHTADDVVLDLARRLEGERGLHVVTSDFADIAHQIAHLRLRHLTSRDFAEILEARLRKVRRPARKEDAAEKPDSRLSATDVADWAREFGFEEEGDGGLKK